MAFLQLKLGYKVFDRPVTHVDSVNPGDQSPRRAQRASELNTGHEHAQVIRQNS
jgi:hypothetical protein